MNDEVEIENGDEWFDPDGWTSVPNRLARDGGEDGLSWEARGMLVYIASHSRSWRTRMRDLEREGNCGRERTRRILGELLDAGYIVRDRRQATPGGAIEWTYRTRPRRSPRVTDGPTIGDPDGRVTRRSGDPIVGKPVHIENTNSSEHQLEEHQNPSPSPLRGEDVTDGGQASLDGMPDPEPVETAPADEYEAEPGFVEFWTAYPSSKGKRAALLAYRRARKRGAAVEALLAGAQSYAAERAGAEARFTAHAATWLNGARYDDVPDTSNPSPARASAVREPEPASATFEAITPADDPEYAPFDPDAMPEHIARRMRIHADATGWSLAEIVRNELDYRAARRDERDADADALLSDRTAARAAHTPRGHARR